MKNIKEKIIVIINPKYWLSSYSTNKYWDKALLKMIEDKAEIKRNGEHRVTIGDRDVWIGNYPYAFGGEGSYNFLPRRSTRILLYKYLAENGIYL